MAFQRDLYKCSTCDFLSEDYFITMDHSESCTGTESAPEDSGSGEPTPRPDQGWPAQATHLLIETFRLHQQWFLDRTKKKYHIWRDIAKKLQLKGYAVDGSACDAKMRSLKRRYRKIKDSASLSGRGALKQWPFYSAMDDLMGGNPSVVPVSMEATLSTNMPMESDGRVQEKAKIMLPGFKPANTMPGAKPKKFNVPVMPGVKTANKPVVSRSQPVPLIPGNKLMNVLSGAQPVTGMQDTLTTGLLPYNNMEPTPVTREDNMTPDPLYLAAKITSSTTKSLVRLLQLRRCRESTSTPDCPPQDSCTEAEEIQQEENGKKRKDRSQLVPCKSVKRVFHFPDLDFQHHIHMTRSTLQEVCELVAPYLTDHKVAVNVEIKVLSALWLLTSLESYREVGERFGVCKATLHKIVYEVCEALETSKESIIVWPKKEEMEQLANEFMKRTGLAGVVGSLSSTQIFICNSRLPKEVHDLKYMSSVILQVVCNANLRFLDVYVNSYGLLDEDTVFRNSPLFTRLENGELKSEYHLVGDKCHQLTSYMMTPYPDSILFTGPDQHSFNYCHSKALKVAHSALALLNNRFQRLSYHHMRMMEKTPVVITAVCVLHNFIVMREELPTDVDNMKVDDDVFMLEVNRDSPEVDDAPLPQTQAGWAKREELSLDLS